MLDTKFISIIKTFSKAQIKEFSNFVHSPFYNRVRNVSSLFDEIKKFYPEFNSRNFTKEYLFKKITGKSNYNDELMRNLFSDLYKLSEEYLAVTGFQKKKNFKNMLTLAELQKCRPEKKILTEFEKLISLYENTEIKDEEFYFTSYQLRNMRNDNFNHKNVEIFQKNISSEISEFAQYFIIHIFDRYFQVSRFRYSYKSRVKHSFLSETIKVWKKYGYMESPLVQIYYDMFMIMVSMDEKYYIQLKELIEAHFKILNHYNRIILFQCMAAFFLNRERSGITKFRNDRFELYRNYEKRGDFIYNNEMDDATYVNAVVAALSIGEFEWAEKFTEDYKKFLPQNMRQDAYYYNLAKILQAKKKNEEALQYLARIIPSNHTIKAVVKVVELQILYELRSFDSIYLKLDSFRHFITKTAQMSANMRESLRNFYKMYSMLTEIKSGNKKFSAFQIKKEKENIKYSHSMEWLGEKINELEIPRRGESR